MNFIPPYLVELGAWNWLIVAALLLGLELMAPGIFLVWLGIAAAVTGVVALMVDIGWQWQLVMFAVLSVVAVVVAHRYLRGAKEAPSDRPLLNRRALQHVGKSYTLAEPIENGRGKIRIGDSLWQVEGPDTPVGKSVTVTGADGTVLHVTVEG